MRDKLYFPAVNLLRGIAALMVCVYHFTFFHSFRGSLLPANSIVKEITHYGAEGVFIFFVISGFVIPLSLFKNKYTIKRFLHYFSRRFIRIEFPYIASILLVLTVGYAFSLKNGTPLLVDPMRVFYHLFYYIPFTKFDWYNTIYWTLAIEFQFYIVMGLTFYFINHKNKVLLYLFLLLFGASNIFFTDHRFVFDYATIFLQGIVLMLLLTKRINGKIGFLWIILFFLVTIYVQSLSIAIFSLFTVFYIYYVKIDKKITNRFGEISYSFYLTHGIVGGNILYLFVSSDMNWGSRIVVFLLGVIASLAFAYFFWKIVENPSRKLSKKIKVKQVG